MKLLRRHHEATVQFQERRAEVRLVYDGATGEIVLPLEPGMAAAPELVLHMPDEVTLQLQVAVRPRVIERPEAEEAVDRWQAYHGAAGSGGSAGRTWVRCEIEGAKRPHAPGEVYAGEALCKPNALRRGGGEFKVVKHVNTRKDGLSGLCRRCAGLEVAEALCVGVDEFGIDVRARFGIVRVEFDLEAATADQARELIDRMLGCG